MEMLFLFSDKVSFITCVHWNGKDKKQTTIRIIKLQKSNDVIDSLFINVKENWTRCSKKKRTVEIKRDNSLKMY